MLRTLSVKPRRWAAVAWKTYLSALLFLHILSAIGQFPQPDSFKPGADGNVLGFAVQGDGRIVVGGQFSTLAGETRECIGRLNPDGTLDAGFNPGANGAVRCLTIQREGKILVGGDFTQLGGRSCSHFGRLNPDGSLDTTFKGGASDTVNAIALRPDGKILLSGTGLTQQPAPTPFLIRLNSDGSFDQTPLPAVNGLVFVLALQPDGAIVLGGPFDRVGGLSCSNLARLTPEGAVDATFRAGTDRAYSGGSVLCLAVQPDGKIVLGGHFSAVNGRPRDRIARIGPDGTLDSDFAPNPSALYVWDVYALHLQADGKILLGGGFTQLDGQPRQYLARLNPDGSLDNNFAPKMKAPTGFIALQPDGQVLAATTYDNRLVRLNSTGPVVQSLSSTDSQTTWFRSGAAPEVWRTVFDYSTDGTHWTLLGQGQRIPGGWQWAGPAPALSQTIRVRGYVFANEATWLTDCSAGPPAISSEPLSQTAIPQASASFAVAAAGSAPLSYQWTKDGSPLADTPTASGTHAPWLNLSHASQADVGAYQVIVSNARGSITSAVATLTIPEPVILQRPDNQAVNLGQDATLSIQARGSAPVSLQWRKDGIALEAQTNSILTFLNVQRSDAGNYDVVVTNLYGAVTSQWATLEVNLATEDTNFVSGISMDLVEAMGLQTDGKIIVGGDFSSLQGQPRSGLGRLNPDGSIDSTFDPIAGPIPERSYPFIDAFVLQPDGEVVEARFDGFRRFNASEPATESLSYDHSAIWARDEAGYWGRTCMAGAAPPVSPPPIKALRA